MIAGLNSMTSTNSLGSTQITLEFDLSRNLDGAAVDVQAAITQSGRLLPQGMPAPPTFTKVNPADQPILYLTLTSQTLPLYTLDEYAETRVCAAHLPDQRSGSGADSRRSKIRRARADGSPCTCRQADRNQRDSNGAAELERQRADGIHCRATAGFHASGQRPTHERRRISSPGCCLSKRLSGPPGGSRIHH